jgi:hypothetical protein
VHPVTEREPFALRTIAAVTAPHNAAGDVTITGRTSSGSRLSHHSGIQMPKNQNSQLLKFGLKIGCTQLPFQLNGWWSYRP